MRAFLAVPVAPPALEELVVLGARLRTELPGVRWTPLSTAHITLHFFGTISTADLMRALGAVEPAVAAQRPLRLRLAGLGSFPDAARPRVLWMGVEGAVVELSNLAIACTAALAGQGFAVEDRPYRPHCTVGRPRQPWPDEARWRWRALAAEQPATSWFVADRAVLYESLTGAAGAQHQPRATIALTSSR